MIAQTISHYKIVEKLGEGGMGIVYKAEDIKLDRLVALKFLPAQALGGEEQNSRFINEAKAAAALNHPNICTIHEIGEAHGQPFIAMEFVEGQSLQEMIRRSPPQVQNLREVLRYALQIADALQAAHNKGVIHRDIKPANIMVTEKGQVKIMDFGLAKLTGQAALTTTGTIVGTLSYLSPEQARGERVDHCTDIWSLGVVLYELVTGRLPFCEDYEAAIVYSIINESPTPPRELQEDLPIELEKIILKCLNKDPEHRFKTARSLGEAMESARTALEQAPGRPSIEAKSTTVKETERRQATVLTVEICGYDNYLASGDPEERATFLSHCQTLFEGTVKEHGGWVEQKTRGRLTAFFGIPTAIENAANVAVQAALDFRQRFRTLAGKQQSAPALDVRGALNTGLVIAGHLTTEAQDGYTIVGEAVSVAEQLRNRCPAGQIYVGSATHRYTQTEFSYREVEPLISTDKTKPLSVFQLVGPKPSRPEGKSERLIHSEMVGRDQELNMLKLHVFKLLNGEGAIVSIIGEPGIGKSRLIKELRQFDALKKVAVLQGRALSIGKNLSYHPIIDMLKEWADITAEDGESQAAVKMEKLIQRVYPDELAEVFPFVATMMGMKLSGKYAERVKGIEGEALEKLIMKNLRELIMKGSERQPLIFILQDLHWADMSSIELLESLYRVAEKHKVLFINVLRPNYPETGERILETLRERYVKIHTEIMLKPLEDSECQTLIQNLLQATGLPGNISNSIANRAEGNPFFIEEVILSLIDEGAIELCNGKFKVTEKIDFVVIPETIHDVLMARIDRLDEETRHLLKNASVIGRYFFYKILYEVAKNIENIDERLDYLKGVQLILKSGRTDELEYLFKHVLTQEVAYESILLKKRKELHLQVAEAIECVFKERLHEFYGMLALHYSKGEDLQKAEEYLTKAGDEALKSAASSEALNYYQEALKIYLIKFGEAANLDRVAELEKNIALAYFNKGQMAEALQYIDKVLHHWGVKRPTSKITTIWQAITGLLSFLISVYLPSIKGKKIPSKRDNEIIAMMEKRGVALVPAAPHRMLTDSIDALKRLTKHELRLVEKGLSIYSAFSCLFIFSGISFAMGKKMLNYAKTQLTKNDVRARLTYNFAALYHDYLSGKWDEIQAYDDDLVDANLRQGEQVYTSSYIYGRGFCLIETGHFEYTARLVAKLLDISESYENGMLRIRKLLLNSYLFWKYRRLADVQKEAEETFKLIRQFGEKSWASVWIISIKAYAQLLLNDSVGAEESLQYANNIITEQKMRQPPYQAPFLLSRFFCLISKLEQIGANKEKVKPSNLRKETLKSGKAAVRNSKKFAPFRTEALKLMGVYYWLINKQKKAIKWWNKSIRTGEHLGARPELARTYFEVGKRLLEPKSKYHELSGISAEEYLNKAQALFKEMELEWDLEQLQRVQREVP